MGARARTPHFLLGLPPPVLGLRPAPELVAARVRSIRWPGEPGPAGTEPAPSPARNAAPTQAPTQAPTHAAARAAAPRPVSFASAQGSVPLGADTAAPTAPIFTSLPEEPPSAPPPREPPELGEAHRPSSRARVPEPASGAASPPGAFEALTAAPMPALTPSAAVRTPAASEATMARLEAAILALRAQGERLAEQARSDALEIGFMVARRILERDVSTDLESLFAMIRSALRRAGESRRTVVHLSPLDASRVRASGEATLTLGAVEIVADEELGTGDVVVETDESTVDGRLGTRLGELRRELSSTLSGD